MPMVDRQWAERQLANAGADPWVEQGVLQMLEAFAATDLAGEQVRQAVTYFAELAQGRHIAPESTEAEGRWIPARVGQIRPGMRVRVRLDAFKGELGQLHNGRLGVVVEVGDGDVIVRSIDARKPHLMAAHYSPFVLEELVTR